MTDIMYFSGIRTSNRAEVCDLKLSQPLLRPFRSPTLSHFILSLSVQGTALKKTEFLLLGRMGDRMPRKLLVPESMSNILFKIVSSSVLQRRKILRGK